MARTSVYKVTTYGENMNMKRCHAEVFSWKSKLSRFVNSNSRGSVSVETETEQMDRCSHQKGCLMDRFC